MGRIVALDYGKVRTGIAVTDDYQLIASGLTTVETKNLIPFLKEYARSEEIDIFVVGEPRQMDHSHSEAEVYIKPFLNVLKQTFPHISIARQDERFTSRMAIQSMVESGLKKKKRSNKALVDEISATIILQAYLNKK